MTYLTSSADCPSCGSDHKGKPLCTYENGVHCFSCGYTKSYDHSFTAPKYAERKPLDFPEGCYDPSKFSLVNLKWLAKYYVDDATVRKFRIVQTHNGGLIFPHYKDDQLVCYQTRWNTEPRMIISHGFKVPALLNVVPSRTLVIVEDFISAVRLAEHINSVCLWGTKVSYEYLKLWVKQYDNILVWLDNDYTKETNSGQEAAKKICNSLNSILHYNHRRYGFGQTVSKHIKNIVAEHDPKCYSASELNKIIGANHATPAK